MSVNDEELWEKIQEQEDSDLTWHAEQYLDGKTNHFEQLVLGGDFGTEDHELRMLAMLACRRFVLARETFIQRCTKVKVDKRFQESADYPGEVV
tara:strand:+ start:313 stop:594 length:282 start_codon:yes stop_codon:yes gene_type:complete